MVTALGTFNSFLILYMFPLIISFVMARWFFKIQYLFKPNFWTIIAILCPIINMIAALTYTIMAVTEWADEFDWTMKKKNRGNIGDRFLRIRR